MADLIARFKGDTSDLDQKIKKASQTLHKMIDEAHKGDGAFINLEKKQLDFVRSLGRMETGCKSAKGTVAELSSAFTNMSAIYNRLSDKEKKDEGGKALRKSLDELKQRIKEGKEELKSIDAEIGNNGSLLDQLSGKFGVNIGQLASWGAAIGAGKLALDVLKDAFFATEEGIDEWGRIVQSSEGAYNTFLDTINGGNWQNFFKNLTDAIQGSRDLYDALDRLGSVKTNNQAAIAIEQKALADARLKLQEAKQKGDKAHIKQIQEEVKAHESRLSALRNQEVTAGKRAGVMQIKDELRSAFNTQEGARPINDKSLNDVANQLLKEGQGAFDKWKETAERLGKKAEGTRQVARTNGVGATSYTTETYTDWSKLSKKEADQLRMARAVTSQETALRSGIGTYAQAINASAQSSQESFRYNRMLGAGTGSGGGKGTSAVKEIVPKAEVTESLTELQVLEDQLKTVKNSMKGYGEGTEEWKAMNEEAKSLTEQIDKLNGKTVEMQVGVSGLTSEAFSEYIKMIQEQMKTADLTSPLYQNLQQNLADTNILQNILKTALQNGIDMTTIDAEGLWDQIISGKDIPDEAWQGLADEINTKLAELGIEPIKIDFQTGKIDTVKKAGDETAEAWKAASQAVGSIGSALQNVEDPTAKVAGIVAQAIATIAGTFASSLKSEAKWGTWDWIAAAAAGTATMLSTVSAIKSATAEYHAQGGIVGQSGPFVPKGTDTIPAMLTPGEVVLSHAQTSNLANTLQGGGMNNMNLETTIHGEDLRILLRNNSRRRGHGEYITTR